jgi:hypothetical protein
VVKIIQTLTEISKKKFRVWCAISKQKKIVFVGLTSAIIIIFASGLYLWLADRSNHRKADNLAQVSGLSVYSNLTVSMVKLGSDDLVFTDQFNKEYTFTVTVVTTFNKLVAANGRVEAPVKGNKADLQMGVSITSLSVNSHNQIVSIDYWSESSKYQ